MRLRVLLLLLVVALAAADPAEPRGHQRPKRNIVRSRDPEDRLQVCVEELMRLYHLHDQGKYVQADVRDLPEELKSLAGQSYAEMTEQDQRLKARVAHLLAGFQRARRGQDESCEDIEGVIGATRLPEDNIRNRQARNEAQKKANEALERHRNKPNSPLAKEEYRFSEAPTFEYSYRGPNNQKFECRGCGCMLDFQKRLRQEGAAVPDSAQLSSQLFREGNTIIAKEEDVASGFSEVYFFFFAPGAKIARIEHYRAA